MEIKFRRDTAFRKQFFVPDSFAHPAKMDAQLLIWLVERYTKEGETILDPMAGSGTTMLACGLGRNVILVELEEKFCKMMRDNWEQVRMRPQLGYSMGFCAIVQGDARQLDSLFYGLGSLDKCIFSPPYADTGHSQGDSEMQKDIIKKKHTWAGQEYSDNEDNIGNLPYGSIDKIVTSPPYSENPGTPSLGSVNKDDWGKEGKDIVARRGLERGYSKDTEGQLGNLPYGNIDAVDHNAFKCYNLDKCLLEFTLELKNIGKPYHGGKEPSGQQVGQTLGNISAWIVGIKLIAGRPDVNLVPYLFANKESPLARRLNEKGVKVIQSIKECLANGTLKKHDLKCPKSDSTGESLELPLIDDSLIHQNGRNGEGKSLREIIIPASYVEQSVKLGNLSILSPIISNELRNSLTWYLKFLMELPSATIATTKPRATKDIIQTYLSEMLRVYQACFSVLKPQGLMILVTKNFIRQKQIVRLDTDTIKLCEQAGFTYLERHYRLLTSVSFWRIIYKQRYPDAPEINREDILVFKK